jgi:hypothetical protein
VAAFHRLPDQEVGAWSVPRLLRQIDRVAEARWAELQELSLAVDLGTTRALARAFGGEPPELADWQEARAMARQRNAPLCLPEWMQRFEEANQGRCVRLSD